MNPIEILLFSEADIVQLDLGPDEVLMALDSLSD